MALGSRVSRFRRGAAEGGKMPETLELTPQEAQCRLGGEQGAVLIDVREPEEFTLSRIAGAQLIPMAVVPAQLQKLEALSDAQTLLILCHHGVRSLQVVFWLREHGVDNCFSVAGGIDRWSREIDPSVPRY